jgi:hypothetical protein
VASGEIGEPEFYTEDAEDRRAQRRDEEDAEALGGRVSLRTEN